MSVRLFSLHIIAASSNSKLRYQKGAVGTMMISSELCCIRLLPHAANVSFYAPGSRSSHAQNPHKRPQVLAPPLDITAILCHMHTCTIIIPLTVLLCYGHLTLEGTSWQQACNNIKHGHDRGANPWTKSLDQLHHVQGILKTLWRRAFGYHLIHKLRMYMAVNICNSYIDILCTDDLHKYNLSFVLSLC